MHRVFEMFKVSKMFHVLHQKFILYTDFFTRVLKRKPIKTYKKQKKQGIFLKENTQNLIKKK